MEELPGYDQWLLPPDPVFAPTYCDECDGYFDASEEYVEGDTCPECEVGTLRETEPSEPCRCRDFCYC